MGKDYYWTSFTLFNNNDYFIWTITARRENFVVFFDDIFIILLFLFS